MPPKSLSLDLSPQQQAILDAHARIKVISACPGAGKTRLFVAALEHYRARVKRSGGGVAALSFTNVAQEEIAQRLGGWDPPHFVGTIDSFLLRFVLRPFGHLAGVRKHGARLIPASLYGHFSQSIRVGDKVGIRANIHDVTFIGEDVSGKVILKAKTTFKVEPVHQDARDEVVKAKQKLWKNFGQISHSDSHYLADAILRGPSGSDIARIITTRFPFILVDELQDTQYFLGQALMRLYDSPMLEGLAVGDPDQAIYEFGGAHSALFEGLSSKDGAQKFTLDISRRCSGAVCKSAVHLSCRGAAITEAEDSKSGRCVLLVLDDDTKETPKALAESVAFLCEETERIVILARKNDTLSLLKGRGQPGEFPGPSKLAGRAHLAVLRLLSGDAGTGRKMIESDLADLVFGLHSGIRESLENAGIDRGAWIKATGSILLEASKAVDGESWEEWQARVKSLLTEALNDLGQGEAAKKLGGKLRTNSKLKAPRTLMLKEDSLVEWSPQTAFCNVHEMKGMEADAVCFYIPKGAKKGKSIAEEWWTPDSEERKIAFVAFTRAKRLLILAVHKSTFDKLQTDRTEFVKTFEIISASSPI